MGNASWAHFASSPGRWRPADPPGERGWTRRDALAAVITRSPKHRAYRWYKSDGWYPPRRPEPVSERRQSNNVSWQGALPSAAEQGAAMGFGAASAGG